MEIIALALLGLFIAYKTGLMDLTQKTVERSADMVDRKMEVMDFESKELHSRKLGKVKKKLTSDSERSTAKELDALFKAIGQEPQTEGQA